MLKTNSRPIFAALIIVGFFLTHLVHAQVSEEKLIQQKKPPTVYQIKRLLEKGWTPRPLSYQEDLWKDSEKPDFGLQHHYPLWYEKLITGAPRMIATFESQFPGATWAFIGRDTWIFYNLFKAFYESIGQKDRVAYLEMSRPILKKFQSMEPEKVIRFLEKKGLKYRKKDGSFRCPQHPFILVDTISKEGGSQGRFLLDLVYSSLPVESQIQLTPYYNFIGLLGSTSKYSEHPVENSYEYIQAHQNRLRSLVNSNQAIPPIPILTYWDDRYSYHSKHYVLGRSPFNNLSGMHVYIGANEAGYTHWTGFWHGPFQEVGWDEDGILSPIATEIEYKSEEQKLKHLATRRAMLDFHAHVIQKVSQPDFLGQVKETAKLLKYTFTEGRPLYIPDPQAELTKQVLRLKLKEIPDFQLRLDAFFALHQSRVKQIESYKLFDPIQNKIFSMSTVDDIISYITALEVAPGELSLQIKRLNQDQVFSHFILSKIETLDDFNNAKRYLARIFNDPVILQEALNKLGNTKQILNILGFVSQSNPENFNKVLFSSYKSIISRSDFVPEIDLYFSLIRSNQLLVQASLNELKELRYRSHIIKRLKNSYKTPEPKKWLLF